MENTEAYDNLTDVDYESEIEPTESNRSSIDRPSTRGDTMAHVPNGDATNSIAKRSDLVHSGIFPPFLT